MMHPSFLVDILHRRAIVAQHADAIGDLAS